MNLPRKITFLDIGARGGLQFPWNKLHRDNIKVVLVEPDRKEAEKLKNLDDVFVIDKALWNKKEKVKLIINKSEGTSSIFSPNINLLKDFPDLSRFDKVKEVDVDGVDLDSILKSKDYSVDFAKVDTQGSELNILKGAKNAFSKTLVGLEVEVEFAQIYSNQPLFHEVDKFIQEELGLELWDIRKTYWKYKNSDMKSGSHKGRLVFGDALYFRPLNQLDDFLAHFDDEEKLNKLCALFSSLYLFGYLDYAFLILNRIIDEFDDKSELIGELKKLYKRKRGNIHSYIGNWKLFRIFNIIANTFKPSHQHWCTIEENLGTKNIGPLYY